VWLVRRLVEAEQILGGPTQRLSLLAPLGQEAPPVLDRLLPAAGRDQVGAATLEGALGPSKCPTSSTLKTFKTPSAALGSRLPESEKPLPRAR